MSLRACTEANDMKLARTRAAEDEIFDQWGLGKSPQQAETENPPPGGIFCFDDFLIKKALLAKECRRIDIVNQNAVDFDALTVFCLDETTRLWYHLSCITASN